MKKKEPKNFGIKGYSILNESKYFNWTENFSFDNFHDLLEGVCQLVVKLVLSKFVFSQDYDLNIDTLNNRIHDFDYGFAEKKAKPSANFTREMLTNIKLHKIKQKAVQTWCLMRVLPFILSDIVQKNDEYLELILDMNQILEIVFAPVLLMGISRYLNYLIYRLEENFRHLFGDIVNLINKFHHLSHYSECIEKSGPMVQNSCLRYEIKHIRMQRYGKICCNYKNISYSLAKMCQLHQCRIWNSDNIEVREKVKFTRCVDMKIKDLVCCNLFQKIGFLETDSMIQTDKVEVYGVVYKIGHFVSLDSGMGTDKNLPIFGEIKEIAIKNQQVYLCCLEWSALYLEESLNAYCIEKGSKCSIILTDNLSDVKTFSIWKTYCDDNSYICLRHILC